VVNGSHESDGNDGAVCYQQSYCHHLRFDKRQRPQKLGITPRLISCKRPISVIHGGIHWKLAILPCSSARRNFTSRLFSHSIFFASSLNLRLLSLLLSRPSSICRTVRSQMSVCYIRHDSKGLQVQNNDRPEAVLWRESFDVYML
jgi:hypothetical protein